MINIDENEEFLWVCEQNFTCIGGESKELRISRAMIGEIKWNSIIKEGKPIRFRAIGAENKIADKWVKFTVEVDD